MDQYIYNTLKEMALREVKDQDPNLAMGVAVMTNFGRNYSCVIPDIYDSDCEEAFLNMLVSKGESRVNCVICVKSDGTVVSPTRSLCNGLSAINQENYFKTHVYFEDEDGSVSEISLFKVVNS